MKKVGILTFHRAKNYGAQVQAYALSQYIGKEFPDVEVEIIDYQSTAEVKYYARSVVRNAIKVSPRAAWDEMRRNYCFHKFANHLPVSDFRIISDSEEKLFQKIAGKYDVVISGSDAIFNWNLRKFPVPFFLGGQLDCVKMSYAASAHGLRYLNEEKEKIEYCGKALSDFNYIGVRDAHTEAMVKHCFPQAEIHHNCDPTFLLDMETLDYDASLKKLQRLKVDTEKPLILVMTADANIVKPVYNAFKDRYEFVSLYLHNPLIDKFVADLTPLEWAGIFKHAALTITEYFHGTLLSLKNSTPVISVDRTDIRKGYAGKIRDVLKERLKLEDMYYEYSSLGTDECSDRMLKVAEQAVSGAYREQIAEAVQEEKKNVESFVEALRNAVNVECKNNG